MICDCPRGASIESVEINGCPFEFGQLRFAIVQRMHSNGTLNQIDDPSLKASWTAVKNATDSTKVVALPNFYSPSIVPGDRQIVGENSNDTPDGIGIVLGEGASTISGNFSQAHPVTISQLKKLECEQLGIYLVNASGRIFGKKATPSDSATTAVSISPIPIKSFFVKGYETGSMDNPTKNDFQMKMPANWAEDLEIVKPTDFNALLELQTVATASV